MYIVNVPIQIKEGFKEQFVAGIKENASHAQNDEPGCLRFNVIQDANDINRIWVYEVYKDEEAFKAHQQSPHYQEEFYNVIHPCHNTLKFLESP